MLGDKKFHLGPLSGKNPRELLNEEDKTHDAAGQLPKNIGVNPLAPSAGLIPPQDPNAGPDLLDPLTQDLKQQIDEINREPEEPEWDFNYVFTKHLKELTADGTAMPSKFDPPLRFDQKEFDHYANSHYYSGMLFLCAANPEHRDRCINHLPSGWRQAERVWEAIDVILVRMVMDRSPWADEDLFDLLSVWSPNWRNDLYERTQEFFIEFLTELKESDWWSSFKYDIPLLHKHECAVKTLNLLYDMAVSDENHPRTELVDQLATILPQYDVVAVSHAVGIIKKLLDKFAQSVPAETLEKIIALPKLEQTLPASNTDYHGGALVDVNEISTEEIKHIARNILASR